MLILAGILATVLVGGILRMAIGEQKEEFVMLRVMGYSDASVFVAVFSHALSLVALGLALAVAAGMFPFLFQWRQLGSFRHLVTVFVQLVGLVGLSGIVLSLLITLQAVHALFSEPIWEVLR